MTAIEPQTIGVLGGMSSQSTIEYYRRIDEGINEAVGGHNDGDLLVRSVNFGDIERFIRTDAWESAGEYLVEAAQGLEAGGADFVVMATNTMHKVAPEITQSLSIPFVHIVDVTADAILESGVETVGVLGTRATMEQSFYRERFAEHGIDVVVPGPAAREAVDTIIFEELTKGVVRADARERYLAEIDTMVSEGAAGIVLGCTEIDLLVEQADRPEIPMFDTTALHVERAIELSLGETTGIDDGR
ncbi:aspartate/glutamate racemase family protein [Natrinema salaciae]|uniref:Aspartate racemase n=1 Tax=Natrinema salaciae TaxID=1186196 RepID=A0A1H9P0G3_9EURY|nr:aspartate/glutamate racemase family protein [Natrinema salaciae]SER41621.1 aspartate racemase [Natrinema salaciae]